MELFRQIKSVWGAKKGPFGPKICFFGLKPLSKVQNFEKCSKFFSYIFAICNMGYVYQFGVILGDPWANKGPKIYQKLSKKKKMCISAFIQTRKCFKVQFFEKYVLSK